MPQLDTTYFATQLFWLAICFIALYVVMAWVGLPAIGGVLTARRNWIDGDLDKAAQMKAEAEAVIAAYERALAEARSEAQATIRETMARLNAEAAQRQHQLMERLGHETAAAERRIAEAKQVALAGLRGVAVEVARAAAAKVSGATVDTTEAGAAVDAVLRERG